MALEAPHRSQIVPGLIVPVPESFARITYNADEDTLIVRNGMPAAALAEPLDDGVWVRIDPGARRVVGFDIEGYRETFLPEHPELRDVLARFEAHGADAGPVMAFWLAARIAALAAAATAA